MPLLPYLPKKLVLVLHYSTSWSKWPFAASSSLLHSVLYSATSHHCSAVSISKSFKSPFKLTSHFSIGLHSGLLPLGLPIITPFAILPPSISATCSFVFQLMFLDLKILFMIQRHLVPAVILVLISSSILFSVVIKYPRYLNFLTFSKFISANGIYPSSPRNLQQLCFLLAYFQSNSSTDFLKDFLKKFQLLRIFFT